MIQLENNKPLLEQFFSQYAERFNRALRGEKPDTEGTIHSFAACFIEANPTGVMCGQNDNKFKEAIPQGYEFYRSIGITAMKITSTEITLLDELHSMVKVGWRSEFIRKDQSSGNIDFMVIYLLQMMDNAPRIFAYITGDEQAALKANGLV